MPKLAPMVLAAALIACLGGGCGSLLNAASGRAGSGRAGSRHTNQANTSRVATVALVRRVSSAPLVTVPARTGSSWKPVATVTGQLAAWIAQRSGVTLMRFDQNLVHLALHAGSAEPRASGWRYGDRIGPSEVHRVLAAFNGGFKLSYGSVGFMAYGRVAVPLRVGLGSIVTYRDGTTQIGAWHGGVPAAGKSIASVRQNLHLLVDHGLPAASVESCVQTCWGSTLGGGTDVARSALGITSEGQLVWAAGESLSPGKLARTLSAAGVQRAVELDINPFWVAGYLYAHHSGGPSAVPVVPGQHGIAGELLEPDSRDFFTVLAN